jgi:Tfp pilus assembly protein FimT
VVLVILMIMASATIPRLRPMMDRSRTREAARSVQLALDSARNLAMTTGRPCGVMIERLPSNTRCSMTLTQVETPPPYAGDSLASVGSVTLTGTDNLNYYVQFAFSASVDSTLASIVHQYDLIQFNFQGPWYTITSQPASGNSSLTASVARSQVQNIPWMQGTLISTPPPVGYEIMRQPTKSAAAALQFPSPAVVDLTASGTDADTNGWAGSSPIVILFSPNGSVDRVYYEGYANGVQRVTQPIYLLVGKIDEVNPPSGPANVADLNSLWVAINPATGLVVGSEMYPAGANDVWTSRTYARQSDAMGGK